MTKSLPALLLAVAMPAFAADVVITHEDIVPRERLAQTLEVRDVAAKPGEVSGVLVNHSDKRLRDVHLRITHLWLWNDEFRPGEDRWTRSDEYVVPRDIPAHGTATFTYRPTAPVAEGSGGHFEVMVEPVQLVEFSDRATAGAPPAVPSAPREPDVPPPSE